MIVLLPVKQYHEAKSRLSFILKDHERESLAEALFKDTFDIIQSIKGVEVVVCTAEKKAMRIAKERGARVIAEEPGIGLNSALTEAVSKLAIEPNLDQSRKIAVIPADLPYLRKADVCRFADLATPALAPDRNNSGTNGLKFNLGAPPIFQYGRNSARHHEHALGAGIQLFKNANFAFDLDMPDDFNRLDPNKCGPNIAEFLCQNRMAA